MCLVFISCYSWYVLFFMFSDPPGFCGGWGVAKSGYLFSFWRACRLLLKVGNDHALVFSFACSVVLQEKAAYG